MTEVYSNLSSFLRIAIISNWSILVFGLVFSAQILWQSGQKNRIRLLVSYADSIISLANRFIAVYILPACKDRIPNREMQVFALKKQNISFYIDNQYITFMHGLLDRKRLPYERRGWPQ